MLYLRAIGGVTSFSDTCKCCELSTRLNVGIVCEILGKDRYFRPGMNPHKVYDFNNDLIGEEKIRKDLQSDYDSVRNPESNP